MHQRMRIICHVVAARGGTEVAAEGDAKAAEPEVVKKGKKEEEADTKKKK